MNWKIVFALLVVSLLLAGCAKGQRGEANETSAGGTSGGTTGGTASGGTGTGVTSGGAGTQTGGTSGGASSGDVGNLFQIDTDKPLEGSGYEVPAAGEE